MNLDRLDLILEHNLKKENEISDIARKFILSTGFPEDFIINDFFSIVKDTMRKMATLLIRIPLNDSEIGAACYRKDGLRYVLLNTSLPMTCTNFAVAHEIYHIYSNEGNLGNKIEFNCDDYINDEDEMDANFFASLILMPSTLFRRVYKIYSEEIKDRKELICYLMSYFKVSYVTILIRCLDLKLINRDEITEEDLHITLDEIRHKFIELGLSDNILNASKIDDSMLIASVVKSFGMMRVEEGILKQKNLEYILSNIENLSEKLKGK